MDDLATLLIRMNIEYDFTAYIILYLSVYISISFFVVSSCFDVLGGAESAGKIIYRTAYARGLSREISTTCLYIQHIQSTPYIFI